MTFIRISKVKGKEYVQVADYVFVNLERSFHLRWVTLHELRAAHPSNSDINEFIIRH